MTTLPPTPTSNPQISALNALIEGVDTILSALLALRESATDSNENASIGLDVKDPRNKQLVGGLEKFTVRGVEVCYRLFDKGMSRYAVAQAMGISFGAANHRFDAWQKAGGHSRQKGPLA